MNSAPALIGATPDSAAAAISSWGFAVTPETLSGVAAEVGEKTILSRTGGAPTLAVGMAHILSSAIGGSAAKAFWYHFAILFEALFILTTIDAGTRVARFMIQDLFGAFFPAFGNTRAWAPNLAATAIAVSGWGYFLYQGVIDPLGGINSLWPLFGIANQLLAAVALSVATTVIVKMGKGRYAWVTAVPLAWLAWATLTAGYQKVFSPEPRLGFLAHARLVEAAGGPNASRMIVNDHLDAALALFFMVIVLVVIVASAAEWWAVAMGRKAPRVHEAPYVPTKRLEIRG
jgi:carbon starvation protein